MRLAALFIGGLLLAGALRAEPPAFAPSDPAARPPRIGLVLSGGGARGMAHVGVLKVLDELQLHVDAIAGTSMGAVVGGLYASGMSARDIEALLNSPAWQDAFRDRPPRQELNFRRKEEDREYLVDFPLGIQGRKLRIPTGLLQEQKLTQLLRQATLPVAGVTQFDQLRVPFRAVATDLETGTPVIMDSGDLATALRASMSAPGVFAPVQRDGRLLVDGGLVENLPIDVARSMDVDVLIVVDAGFPLQPRSRLTSLASVSNQALAILVRRDVGRQRATLTPQDVLIEPTLGDRSSYDFRSVASAVAEGEAAARVAQKQLIALAVATSHPPASVAAAPAAVAGATPGAAPAPPGAAAQAPVQAQPSVPPPPSPAAAEAARSIVRFIATDPESHRYQGLMQRTFADQVGKPVDADLIAHRLAVIYGNGNFEVLDWRLTRSSTGEEGLLFTAHRNSWGPNYLRLGLSLQDDFQGNSIFNAAARVTFTELNYLGGEARLDLRVGASPHAAAEFYQPLSPERTWFAAPHIQAEAHDVPQLQNGDIIGEYRVRNFDYGLDLGRVFGNWGELRGGLMDTRGSTYVRYGDFSVPEQTYHMPAGFVRFSYDQLDSVSFPRSGQALTLNYRTEFPGRGAAGSDLAVVDWRGAVSRGKNTLMGWVSGGSTVGGSDTNVREYFLLGGFLNLSGLATQSLAGPQFVMVRGIYMRSVGNGGEGILDVPAYVGISAELGNVWQQRSEINLSSARRDASVFFGADTFIGPAYLAVGYDEGGTTALYLYLGRTF
jgi:NTE family protein